MGATPTGVMVTADDTVLVSAAARQGDDTITGGVVATITPGTTSGAASSVQGVDVGAVWWPRDIASGTAAANGDDTAIIVGSICGAPGETCDDTAAIAYWSVPDDTVVITRVLGDLTSATQVAVTADGGTAIIGREGVRDDSLAVLSSPSAAVELVPLGLDDTLNVSTVSAVTTDDTVWFAARPDLNAPNVINVGYFSLDDTTVVTRSATACGNKPPMIALTSGVVAYPQTCSDGLTDDLGLRASSGAGTAASWAVTPSIVSNLASDDSYLLAGDVIVAGANFTLRFSVLDPISQTVSGSVTLPYVVLDSARAPGSGLYYVVQGPDMDERLATSLAVIDNVAVSGLSVSGGSAGTSTSFDVTATSGATWDDSTIESVTFGGASASFSRVGNTVTAAAPAGSGSVAVVVHLNGGNSLNVGTFTYPSPPPTYPPSAPRDVTAVSGDKAATVSWSAPASSGSFAISNYQVRSTPASDGCMTAELTCEISDLVNGTAYTFEVRALNGAGWGQWSLASEPVTPGPAVSIVITGTRGTVKGKPGVIVDGTTTGLVGATVTPWFRFPGQSSYSEGTGARTVDTEGRFTWVRQTGKRIYVYFRSGDTRSNRVIIDR